VIPELELMMTLRVEIAPALARLHPGTVRRQNI
jgi:hypothetical protein